MMKTKAKRTMIAALCLSISVPLLGSCTAAPVSMSMGKTAAPHGVRTAERPYPAPEMAERSEYPEEIITTQLERELLGPEEGDGPGGDSVPLELATALSFAAASDEAVSLAVSSKFAVTRPEKAISTTYSAYFITGTSNPDQPVYFEGKEIERQGSKGVFGVLVSLSSGENTFRFSQGNEAATVTITRKAAGVGKISAIDQDSMFPRVQGGVKVGGSLPVSCTAPSGAKVIAKFGGASVELTQSAQVNPGLPAYFTGKLPVKGDYDPDVTAKIGPVTYELTYNGGTKSYKSTGSVYVAGEDSYIAARVVSYAGFVYPDIQKLYSFKEKVKKGAADYIVDQGNNYLKLSSGGWIPTEMVQIVEGGVRVSNSLKDASSSYGDTAETYTFTGTRAPVYYSRVSDGVFYLSLYNTKGTPSVSVSSSKLFSSASVGAKDSYVTYAFTLKSGASIWGYDISFDGGDTILKFNYRPRLSTDPDKPFQGIRIMLDPGHGGSDPGALGVAGKRGPDEKTVNLAHAYAIRDELEAMGAKVTLTRSGDSYFSLDNRLGAIEDWDADIFLSIHHNSVREDADANKISGMEIYYHTGYSKKLADSMMSGLANGLNRNNRSVKQSYYRVTLMPYAPAILMELGYLSNPLEYEKATSQKQIDQVAAAVANGLKQALK